MGTLSRLAFEKLFSVRQGQALAHWYWESIARGIFREVTTNATFAPLEDVHCSSVCFSNNSGAAVGVRRGNSGVVIVIPNGAGKVFDVEDNAFELQVRNNDANVDMTIQYECGGELLGITS